MATLRLFKIIQQIFNASLHYFLTPKPISNQCFIHLISCFMYSHVNLSFLKTWELFPSILCFCWVSKIDLIHNQYLWNLLLSLVLCKQLHHKMFTDETMWKIFYLHCWLKFIQFDRGFMSTSAWNILELQQRVRWFLLSGMSPFVDRINILVFFN